MTAYYCFCGKKIEIARTCLAPEWATAQFKKVHSGPGHRMVDIMTWLDQTRRQREFAAHRRVRQRMGIDVGSTLAQRKAGAPPSATPAQGERHR